MFIQEKFFLKLFNCPILTWSFYQTWQNFILTDKNISIGNKAKPRRNQHWWGSHCWKSTRTRNSHSIRVRNIGTEIGRRRYSTVVLIVEWCVPKCQLHTCRNVRTKGRNPKSLRRRIFGVRWRWRTRITLDGKGKKYTLGVFLYSIIELFLFTIEIPFGNE